MKKQDPVFDAALALHRAGKLEQAAQAYRRILKLRPGHGQALNNLGTICHKLGLFDESRRHLERAVTSEPQAWSNLSSLEIRLGRNLEAATAAQRAIDLLPGLAAAYDNLGLALFRLDAISQAEQATRKALALDPNSANAWNNLGQVLQRQSRLTDAVQAYQQAINLNPGYEQAYSNMLFCMHFDGAWTSQQIFEAHRRWGQHYEASVASPAPKYRRSKVPVGSRPRIAFLTTDLFDHPVTMFLRSLIANWPHSRMELGFYASVKRADEVTQWFKDRSDFWCDALPLSDEQLATRIAQDEIDLLIELSGHTGESRLKVLVHRPAPVQMSWLGYFDTTGLQCVQYILTDGICVTPQMEHLFTESVLRMPDDFVCFDPPAYSPDPGPLPALTNGFITFGSQNQLAKVTDEVISLWSQLLLHLPRSRLLFQAKAFNDSETLHRFQDKFSGRGVDLSRVDFLLGTSRQQILQNYLKVDIALDPFPCAGGTTTCESLWMGVPVVTLQGDRFGGRHSASHLSAVGLERFIAQDVPEYLKIVSQLSLDLPSLAQIRSTLRGQMRASALCDGPRFTRNFEALIGSIINIS